MEVEFRHTGARRPGPALLRFHPTSSNLRSSIDYSPPKRAANNRNCAANSFSSGRRTGSVYCGRGGAEILSRAGGGAASQPRVCGVGYGGGTPRNVREDRVLTTAEVGRYVRIRSSCPTRLSRWRRLSCVALSRSLPVYSSRHETPAMAIPQRLLFYLLRHDLINLAHEVVHDPLGPDLDLQAGRDGGGLDARDRVARDLLDFGLLLGRPL